MKANTSKERSFYTQGQRFAARILFILWLLASGSPEGALATPKRQMVPATTTSPGDPALASVPPLPLPGGQLPPDSPCAFWGDSVASSPSIDAALQERMGQEVATDEGSDLLRTSPKVSPVSEHFSFEARGGENVHFHYQIGQWSAEVSSHIGGFSRQSVLPVVCSQGEDVASSLEVLSRYPSWYSQRQIHVLDGNVCPTLGAVVYVGELGLKGGGEQEASGSGEEREEYEREYDNTTFENLARVRKAQSHLLQVVFHDQSSSETSFVNQLAQLKVLLKLLGKAGALFISRASHGSPYLLGVLYENILILLNPIGVTQDQGLHTVLSDIKQQSLVAELCVSNPLIEQEKQSSHAGPILAELMLHYSQLSEEGFNLAVSQLYSLGAGWQESISDQASEQSPYTAINISSLLPQSLSSLGQSGSSSPGNTEEALTNLRQSHVAILSEVSDSTEYLPEQLVFNDLVLGKSINAPQDSPYYRKLQEETILRPEVSAYQGDIEQIVAPSSATPNDLKQLMSQKGVPDNDTLLAALNAAPPQEQRQWIEKAVEWFKNPLIPKYSAAIRDYAALAHIQVTPENRHLLEDYLHSLCNKVTDDSFREKPFIQALAYALEHLDPAFFKNDPSLLTKLANALLAKLKRSENAFTQKTYPTDRITLEALFQTLFLAQKLDSGQLEQKEGSLYQNFSNQLTDLAAVTYYPVKYYAQILKQTLELLAKIKDVSTRQQVWKGCQAVLHGLEGGFYFYQGINKLIPFSSLEALSNLSTIPFKSSYSAFTKSYAIIKEILPKLDREANHWYSYLLQIYDYSAQLLAGEASSCDRIVAYLKAQKDFLKAQQILRVSQPAVTKGEKALRFGIVQQLQKLSLLGPTPEVRKKIIEQLSSLSQPEAWGSDGEVMAGLLESLALVATQSQADSDREAEATMAHEALKGFTADASAAQWLAGETLSAKLQRLRERTPSDEERLFIQVKKILPSASSISPSETRAQLASYYSKTDFPYVKSLIFDEQLPKHVQDLECQLMLLEQKLVKQDKDKEGAEAREDHIAKHHERRFEWVKTPLGSEDLFKKRSIKPGDPEKEISRILLTGDPGTGKTTLSKKLSYQWSQGQWGQEFHTLYLLPVRSLQQSEYDGTRYNRERTLGTAIVNNCFVHELPATEDEYNRLRDHIEEELEKPTTLLILDGLDERAGASEQILTQAQAGSHKLLMLSRPYGIETERQTVDIEIEHVGFNRVQLRSYVLAEVSDGEQASELLDYIDKHENIRSIAHVPVNLQILCALWQDEGYDVREVAQQGSLPGLYRLVTDFTWQRYTKKWGLANESEEALFDTLGQIALAALQQGEVLISPGLVHQYAKQETAKAKLKDAGFLLLQYVGEDAGRQSGFYEFPHLTFQEYFAGRALAQQCLSKEEEEREEASDFLSEHKYERQYGRTLSFMAGEVSRRPKGVKGIKELLRLLREGDQELVGVQHLLLQLQVVHEWLCIASEQEAEKGMNKLEDAFQVLSSLEEWFVRAFVHVRLEGYDAGRPGRDLLGLLQSSLQTFGSIARYAPELLELFKKTAQGPHGAVRLAAVSSLGGALAGIDGEVRAMLQAMVDDRHESNDIKRAAREALSQATGAESTQDEAAVGGGTAQGSLGEASESASQSPEALLEQLRQAARAARREKNKALRSARGFLVQAVAAATQENLPALLDLLLPAAKDRNVYVRVAALEALLKAPLEKLLEHYWPKPDAGSKPDIRLIPYITPRLYHTPLVIAQSVRSGPQRVSLYAAAGQAREWRQPQVVVEDFKRHIQDAVSQLSQVESKLSARIDKSVWEHYFGAVGEEPALPDDLEAILNSPCPFWEGRQVRDTHMLVLIPSHVGGQPLTLDYLGELIKSPQEGYGTKYLDYYVGDIGNQSPGKSYWVLMTKDVLPGSRWKSYQDQCALVSDHATRTGISYEVPGALEAAVVMLLHHVRSGERLYSVNPETYTRCRDKDKYGDPVVVGGFSSGGLNVHDSSYDNDNGVAGLRKF